MKNMVKENRNNRADPQEEKNQDTVNILFVIAFSIFFYSVIKTIKSAIMYRTEINFSMAGFIAVFATVFIGCKLFAFIRRKSFKIKSEEV